MRNAWGIRFGPSLLSMGGDLLVFWKVLNVSLLLRLPGRPPYQRHAAPSSSCEVTIPLVSVWDSLCPWDLGGESSLISQTGPVRSFWGLQCPEKEKKSWVGQQASLGEPHLQVTRGSGVKYGILCLSFTVPVVGMWCHVYVGRTRECGNNQCLGRLGNMVVILLTICCEYRWDLLQGSLRFEVGPKDGSHR